MQYLTFPLFITWNITSNCNLRCKHCFRSEYEYDVLTEEKIDKFIDLFVSKGVGGIILTGGEPLKSKYLFYILKKAKGKLKIGIATNGTLFTEETIDKLLKYNVKNFQISLDGPTAFTNDYIRGKGVFDKVVKNIKKLNKYKCHITLAMTVNSFNYNDIFEKAFELLNKLDIKKLRIEYYIPINKNQYFKSVSYQQMLALKNHLDEINKNKINIQFPCFDNKIGCGAGIYNCVLNSDLTVSPCDLLTHKYKSKKIERVDSFQQYWENDISFVEWRKKINCMSCQNEFKCLALMEVDDD